ncbi:MAG: HAD family hydrolase [Schwartzia succinivorans]|nr:HAD family hydrolase [Schwartzia succinivorans]
MIRAIIFDFDGVILESASIKTDAFAEMVKAYPAEIGTKFVEFHLAHMGISRKVKFQYLIEDLLGESCTEGKLDALGQKFSEIVHSKILVAPFVPGAREFLESSYKKLVFYIASGTPQEELRQIVAERGIEKYFTAVYGSPAKKEKIVEHIMQAQGYEKEEVLFVGDADTDLFAARASGIPFVGRSTPENIEAFREVKDIIDDLRQLETICARYET